MATITTTATKTDISSKHSFFESTVIRRSTIDLKKESPIPDDQIISIVKHAILHAPSPFHTQSARAVILLGAQQEKFWDLAYTAAEKVLPPEMFNGKAKPNLAAYKAAHGTVSRLQPP